MGKSLKNEIIELYKLGFTYNEIKQKLNCSKSTISYHCNNAKISRRNNISPTSEQIDEMKKLYDTNKSCYKVSEITGWSKKTVLKYIDVIKLSDVEKKSRRVKSVMEWRRKTKERLVKYKGGKCEVCSYDKCLNALEFHHLSSNEKDFQISGKSLSFEKLKKEVDKCVLVCSNCHKEIHAGLIQL